jgi:thiamine-phosphate pyrophosphorylase
MFEILAVTKRRLCPPGTFLGQIEKIAASGIKALILREKDLSLEDYTALARDVMAVCAAKNVQFIIHSKIQAAIHLQCPYLHLPWQIFEKDCLGSDISLWRKNKTISFGVSVHNQEEAALAIEHGASWLIAGHIYVTQSKEGLEGRGLDFLAQLCTLSSELSKREHLSSPPPGCVRVYGIGGINESNIKAIARTGAAGACLMSSLMLSPAPSALIRKLRASFMDFYKIEAQ